MRRCLYVLLVATAIFASCSKDESGSSSTSGNDSGVLAKDIVGTWEFEAPKYEDVVVKLSGDTPLKDVINGAVKSSVMGGLTYLSLYVTFNIDMSCSAVSKSGSGDRYSGIYQISKGRIMSILINPKETVLIYGLLQIKEDSTRYLNFDRDAVLEYEAETMRKAAVGSGLSSEQIKEAVNMWRSVITEVTCPIKMVPKKKE